MDNFFSLGKSERRIAKRGSSCVFGEDVEINLCKRLIEHGAFEFGRTRLQVLEIVEQYLTASNIIIPAFNGNRPGKTWWYRFLARHPEIRCKTPSPLETGRAIPCTEDSILSWFSQFQKTLLQEGITSAGQVCYYNNLTCIWYL